METLGAEKALELLYCTEDLEEAGGLMTLVFVVSLHHFYIKSLVTYFDGRKYAL